MRRKIIKIDEDKCNGCGVCIPNCPEGALQIIGGKARLSGESVCDGLGACLGHCPEDAITVEEREAESYNEKVVVANLAGRDGNALKMHLRHLKESNETMLLQEALEYLREQNIRLGPEDASAEPTPAIRLHSGCPGSRSVDFAAAEPAPDSSGVRRASRLTRWPIQLHLINPMAPHFQGSNLLLAADCVAYALGDFHEDYLKDKTLAIACPKLDDGQDIYLEKLAALIDRSEIQSLTVLIMQVPCCSGLLNLARTAVERAERKIPLRYSVVGIQGQVLQQGDVSTSKESAHASSSLAIAR